MQVFLEISCLCEGSDSEPITPVTSCDLSGSVPLQSYTSRLVQSCTDLKDESTMCKGYLNPKPLNPKPQNPNP